MTDSIFVDVLNQKKADEISTAINLLQNSKESIKELPLTLMSTTGDYALALDIAEKVHNSNVDLIITAKGNMDASGTILATAGKKGQRHASFGAIFSPFEDVKKAKGDKTLTAKDQAVLSGLKSLKARERNIRDYVSKGRSLSAKEAKRYKLVDVIDKFESKYKETKKTGKKKVSKTKTRSTGTRQTNTPRRSSGTASTRRTTRTSNRRTATRRSR